VTQGSDPLERDEEQRGEWLAGTSWRSALDLPLATTDETSDGSEPMSNTPRRGGGRFDQGVPTKQPTRDPEVDAVVAPAPVDARLVDVVGIDEAVAVATVSPTGEPIDDGLQGLTVGGASIDVAPDHHGVDGGDALLATTLDATLSFGTTTTSAAPTGDSTFSTGLGPLPGSSLFADDTGDGEGDVAGQPLKPFEKKPEPEPAEKGILDRLADGVQYVKDALTPDGSGSSAPDGGTPGKTPPGKLKPFGTYDNPDADPSPTAVAPSDVVLTTIVTGVDPTTTTPSGPSVDDGGADPITSDDITGAAPTGGFDVPMRPGVIDGGGEVIQSGDGDPSGYLLASEPRTVGPNDPILGGAEPLGGISADDLRSPGGGTANPIAGGEDEDLEDLEIQRLTPGSTPSTASAVDVEVSAAPPSSVDLGAFESAVAAEPFGATAIVAMPLAGGQDLAVGGDLSDAGAVSALPAFDGPGRTLEPEPAALDDGLDGELFGGGGDLP
jgi:hypothetical protein